MFA
ncbi:hypothetical protein ECEC4196_1642, partial [Escherichia coli EC4196]|jgi:hypothetical protein